MSDIKILYTKESKAPILPNHSGFQKACLQTSEKACPF